MTLFWYVRFFVAVGISNEPGFPVALNCVSGVAARCGEDLTPTRKFGRANHAG